MWSDWRALSVGYSIVLDWYGPLGHTLKVPNAHGDYWSTNEGCARLVVIISLGTFLLVRLVPTGPAMDRLPLAVSAGSGGAIKAEPSTIPRSQCTLLQNAEFLNNERQVVLASNRNDTASVPPQR